MEEAVAPLQVDPGHDAWFKAEVARALAEAADPATARVFHDDVLIEWRARRDDIVKRARSQ